jgi:radical SAM superfamily enzyme YgiQ (UPF0313 family)
MSEDLKKELILINPKCGNFVFRNAMLLMEKWFPPISLLTLAALTPKDYKIEIYNLRTFWPKEIFKKDILVGITCYTANVKRAYDLAKRYKDAGAYVVMGGHHVSYLPQEALQYCHSVVIGEAESVWAEVLKDYRERSLKKIYTGEPLDDFFTPVFESFKRLYPVLLINSIQTTRGCKNVCEFCAVPNRKLRFVKHEQVVALVKVLQTKIKRPHIYFKDDNIFSDPQYAKNLFRLLIPLNIKWYSSSSIDIALDEEALRLARESGCYQLVIGFETIYPENLQKAKRAEVKKEKDYLPLIKKIQSYDIRIRGAFIMGFDYDRILDYFKLIAFLVKARLFVVVLSILTPLPGTALRSRLEKEGRIFTNDWNKYDGLHTVFKPKHMPAHMLTLSYILVRFITLFLGSFTLTLLIIAAICISYLVIFKPFK